MITEIKNNFNETTFDFRTYAYTDDELSHLFQDWVPYYRMKYAICKAINPKSILETGVRYGYSAIAFLNAAPNAKYLGIDNDTNTFGGSPGAIHHAKKILNEYHADIMVADSQKMDDFPGDHWDLIHIDGQQDGDGTFHDLEMAIRKASWILVDGYFWSEENMLATSYFMKKYCEFIDYAEIIPGYAGDILVKVKEQPLSNNTQYAGLTSAYTQAYYLSNCGGFLTFKKTNGEELDNRLLSVLLIADPKKEMNILDIGCGRGELAYALAKAGARVTGLDYSPDAIKIALATYSDKTISGHLEFYCADIIHHPFSTTFDRIILSDVVEHLEPLVLHALLVRCLDLLSPDGILVIHTAPNRLYYEITYTERREKALAAGCWIPINPRTYYEDIMHLNEQTPDSLSNILFSVFPHYHVWVTEGSDLAGSLASIFDDKKVAATKDIYAVASRSIINKDHLISLITQDPLIRDGVQVSISLIDIPDTIYSRHIFSTTVLISNQGMERLASLPFHPIYVSYHWKENDGSMAVFEGIRTPLPLPLNPSDERMFMIDIMAPDYPGVYNLELTMVQENCCWFEEIKSFNLVQIESLKVL